MTLPFRDNFLHLGVPWEVIKEIEAQLTSPNFTTLFGGALGANDPTNPPFMASMNESGNLYRAVGNPFFSSVNNAAAEQIIGGIVLPAGAFDISGRGLNFTLQGNFSAATAAAKTFNISANPTMTGQTVTNGVISGGTITSIGTGYRIFAGAATANVASTGWQVMAQFFKYGAAGSNTQYSQGTVILGAAHGGINVATFGTQAENAAMNIVFSVVDAGANAAAVLANFIEVTAFN